MKVRILESARNDLVDGFYFYEKQADGVGSYFLDSIYSDIESLIDNAGIHPLYFDEYNHLLSPLWTRIGGEIYRRGCAPINRWFIRNL